MPCLVCKTRESPTRQASKFAGISDEPDFTTVHTFCASVMNAPLFFKYKWRLNTTSICIMYLSRNQNFSTGHHLVYIPIKASDHSGDRYHGKKMDISI